MTDNHMNGSIYNRDAANGFGVPAQPCGAGHDLRLIVGVTVAALFLSVAQLFAGSADVVDVEVQRTEDAVWRFDVSVRHADTGWDHYADQWRIEDLDGQVLGTRELLHPHVDEQPFTRSLGGVRIPDEVDAVRVVARDTVHGDEGRAMVVDLQALRNGG